MLLRIAMFGGHHVELAALTIAENLLECSG